MGNDNMIRMLKQNAEAVPTLTAVLLGHLLLNIPIQEEMHQLSYTLLQLNTLL